MKTSRVILRSLFASLFAVAACETTGGDAPPAGGTSGSDAASGSAPAAGAPASAGAPTGGSDGAAMAAAGATGPGAGTGESAAAPATPLPPLRMDVKVTKKGFEPQTIDVKRGQPLLLTFTRTEAQTCAKEVIFDDPPVKAELPLDKPVSVAFTPQKTGELKFGCAMGKMIWGKVVVAER